MDLLPGCFADPGKDREQVDQLVHVLYVLLAHANGRAHDLHVVREEHTYAANTLFERHRLDFELHSVVAKDVRPDIGFRAQLQVGMAELEDDLGLADGKAVLVGDAAPQNEGVVIKAKVVGVDEYDFAKFHWLGIETGDTVLYAMLSGGRLEHLGKVEEALARME